MINKTKIFRNLIVLAGLGGLAAVGWLLSIPGEGGLLGYSLTRWVLVLAVFVPAALLLVMAWYAPLLTWIEGKLQLALQRWWLYWVSLTLAVLLLLSGTFGVLLSLKFTDAVIQAQLTRLAPFMGWGAWLGLCVLILLPYYQFGNQAFVGIKQQPWRAVLVAWVGLGLLIALVRLTGWGLTPDLTGWDSPGTPLMSLQVWFAWLAGLLVLSIQQMFKSRRDVFAFLLIWLVAMLVWWAQPLGPTYFSPEPIEPNYEYYPYSDAALLAVNSEGVLMGQGLKYSAEKPLYNIFLAGLLWLGDHNYDAVVNLQIVVLGLFPALVYWLSVKMDVRLAGLIAAGLLILRERNAIALSGKISVSHSKLMMTDFPAALGMAGLILLLSLWLRNPEKRLLAFWAGGGLGVFLLLRSQAILLIPVILIGMIVVFWGRWREIGLAAGLFLLGVILPLLPWMTRNAIVDGHFGFASSQQSVYIASQYRFNPLDEVGADEAAGGFSAALGFMGENPGYVASFLTSHILHNEVSGLLALPVQFDAADKVVAYDAQRKNWHNDEFASIWDECCDLEAEVTSQPYWDYENGWQGNWPPKAVLPLFFNLALIGVGFGIAWRKAGLLGLMPLVIHLSYSATTAVARVSGWRLILPVDWVLIWYYAIGLAGLTMLIWRYLNNRKHVELNTEENAGEVVWSWRQFGIAAILIFVIGLSVPLAEIIVPERQLLWNETKIAEFENMYLGVQSGVTVVQGRALFPRYYLAEPEELGGEWPAFDPHPYDRLGFFLVGTENAQVVLPIDNIPDYFPNAADVLVFGCREEGYLRALAVVVGGDEDEVIYFSEGEHCEN